MNWQDAINGTFELCGGFFVCLHILKVMKDKEVKGVSVTAAVYFALWGLWNLYYYYHLQQTLSWFGGVFVTTANIVWVILIIHYLRTKKRKV